MPKLPIARIIIAVGIVLAIVAFLAMKGCESNREKAAQAKQETRSAEAYAGAAKEAVETVTARSAAEEDLRVVVNEAAKEIADAKGSEQPITPEARRAALRAACRLPNYSNDPACTVFRADP